MSFSPGEKEILLSKAGRFGFQGIYYKLVSNNPLEEEGRVLSYERVDESRG